MIRPLGTGRWQGSGPRGQESCGPTALARGWCARPQARVWEWVRACQNRMPWSRWPEIAVVPSAVTFAAHSRCRCGRSEPSPGADVARGEPSPGADAAGASPVRCGCSRGEPSPGADVVGVSPFSPGADVGSGLSSPSAYSQSRSGMPRCAIETRGGGAAAALAAGRTMRSLQMDGQGIVFTHVLSIHRRPWRVVATTGKRTSRRHAGGIGRAEHRLHACAQSPQRALHCIALHCIALPPKATTTVCHLGAAPAQGYGTNEARGSHGTCTCCACLQYSSVRRACPRTHAQAGRPQHRRKKARAAAQARPCAVAK